MRSFPDSQTYSSLMPLAPGVGWRFALLVALCASILMSGNSVSAQQASETKAAPSSCSRDNVLEIVRQQIDDTKTLDDSVQRIRILIRAAEMLWPYQPEKARAAFTEAFDLATQHYKEKGDKPKRGGLGLFVETPDQRFVVIRAVAKRDAALAKRLTDEMLRRDRQEAEEALTRNVETDIRTADKLLDTARYFLSSDVSTAINFAAVSLRYPATMGLTSFLYRFAEVDQRAADQFYRQALAAYGDKPMREFLYLTAYPFGFPDPGDMPFTGSYRVPAAFVPSESLQRLFIQLLLHRVQQTSQVPLDEGDNYNGFPGMGHILQVLTRIEPEVRKRQPDLIGAVQQARTNTLASLSQEAQSAFLKASREQESAPSMNFDEQIAAASKEPNISRRDELLVTAILDASQTERLDNVIKAADKISDSGIRSQLMDWLYFDRAQAAIKDKRFDEAGRLAAKVQALDQRAYLYSEIARDSLKKIENQNQVRTFLDEIVEMASKGPNTVTAARALFSAAYLYLKLEPGRSIAILGDAVKRINQIESPDFSSQSLIRRIEGKNFARYAIFKTPGFDPENAFREMANIDFDNSLALANGFADKSTRALMTLNIADICLQRTEQQEKAEKAKKRVKP